MFFQEIHKICPFVTLEAARPETTDIFFNCCLISRMRYKPSAHRHQLFWSVYIVFKRDKTHNLMYIIFTLSLFKMWWRCEEKHRSKGSLYNTSSSGPIVHICIENKIINSSLVCYFFINLISMCPEFS